MPKHLQKVHEEERFTSQSYSPTHSRQSGRTPLVSTPPIAQQSTSCLCARHEGILGSECIASLNFNLSTRWRRVGAFRPRPFYSRINSPPPPYQLYRGLGVLHRRCGRFGVDKKYSAAATANSTCSRVHHIQGADTIHSPKTC
jgi:hypothetical protein